MNVRIVDEKKWFKDVSDELGEGFNQVFLVSKVRHRRKETEVNQVYYFTVPKSLIKSGVINQTDKIYIMLLQGKQVRKPLLHV